jgi:mannose/fructose-specific phosphotransferase system component IIA|tara:strand:- start:2231 stop:2470 length:240 start_codon:yes stop_codon:yes gene_type:complete
MPKNKDKELQDIYNKIFEQAVQHMKKHEPQMVAGTLMAIAIRLYKTSLSEDGFSEMLQTILESEKDVKSYFDDEGETIH